MNITSVNYEQRARSAGLITLAFTLLCMFEVNKSFATACNVMANNEIRKVQKTIGLDTDFFAAQVANKMQQSNVKGYAFNVFNRWGESVASSTRGLARTACSTDGEQRFNLNTETPWGSVSKLLTTSAAIHAVDAHNLSFDDEIVNYLPYRWRSELHSRFQGVTLAMLLQHRAGFRHSGCGRPVRDRLHDGDALNNCSGGNLRPSVNTRQYSNAGAGIYYVLLAYMAEPMFMQSIEFGYQNHSDASYDAIIQQYTAAIYNNYVKDEVFSPANVSATCNMADNGGGNYALWYSSASDSVGDMPSDQSGHCSSGGWILSSQEMTRVLHQLKHSDTILSTEGYALMESSWQDSLGWWRIGSGTRPHYNHNGAWGDTRSQVYALQGGYTATLVANSAPGNDISFSATIIEAYEVARHRGVSQLAAQVALDSIL